MISKIDIQGNRIGQLLLLFETEYTYVLANDEIKNKRFHVKIVKNKTRHAEGMFDAEKFYEE